MKKVRVRTKVKRLPVRTSRSTIHYVKPDPSKPHVVQVFVAPNVTHMRTTAKFKEGSCSDNDFSGMVRSYSSGTTKKPCVRPRMIIARMYLNAVDLKNNGAEILCHECTHAGMAWARLRKANLAKMEGEEVMAYATGRMHKQLCTLMHTLKIWG